MKPAAASSVSATLLRQLKIEAECPQWREGFAAFDAREPFTMSHGRDWAMGWLSCRLVGAQVPTVSRH